MANQSVVDQVHAHFQGRTGKNTGGRLDPLCWPRWCCRGRPSAPTRTWFMPG